MTSTSGPLGRAGIAGDAGELELRLSRQGSWVLHGRAAGEPEWRRLADGSLDRGATVSLTPVKEGPVRIGALLVDAAARRVCVGETEVALGRREFDLLAMLASAPTRVFHKEDLYREVLGYTEDLGSSRALDSYVSRIRVKLRAAGIERMPVNCWGVGYKLMDGPPLVAAADRRVA